MTNITPDYIIKISDVNTPLIKSITIGDIAQFYVLYDKNSTFHNWCNDNYNRIVNVALMDQFYEKIKNNQYFDKDLDDFIDDIENIQNYFNNEEISNEQIRNNNIAAMIGTMIGGNNSIFDLVNKIQKEKQIFTILTFILFFLFSKNKIEMNILPVPASLETLVNIPNVLKGGFNAKFNDVSGNKKNARLVYLIGYNDIKCACKIMPKMPSYENEMNIYNELKNYNDVNINENIINLYSSGETDTLYENLTINLTANISVDITKDYPNIHETIKQFQLYHQKNNLEYTALIYIVTENDTDYKKLSDCLNNGIITSGVGLGNVVINAIKILNYLNNKIGFIHWDLWIDNLFVNYINEDLLYIKLYDFDASETTKNPNSFVFDLFTDIMGQRNDVTNDVFHKKGLLFDIVRLIDSINVQESINHNSNKQYIESTDIKIQNIINYTCKLLDKWKNKKFDVKYNYHELLAKFIQDMSKWQYNNSTMMEYMVNQFVNGNTFGGSMKKYILKY